MRVGQASLDGQVQVLDGLKAGDEVVVYSEKELGGRQPHQGRRRARRAPAMISLAGRDILHSWGKFVLTGIGLGLLIGVTLTMAGVYRGMVDDARALLNNSGADLWVVQQDTQGPYAESSSLRDDVVRSVLGLPGVARAANVTYLTMQVRQASAAPGRRATTCARWSSASSPGSRASRATWWRAGTSRAATTKRWPTCAPASRWATASASAATTTRWSA